MNESIKTCVFVAVAGAMAALAVSHFRNQPTNSADFELVGKEFFEDFQSAKQAQSLEVSAVDPETGVLKRFSVENQEGLWRIPSHYDYPAEAAVRLAETASSVIGISRDSLGGRLAKEHERLGVVDPLGDEIDDPEAVGKRITLKDEDGEVVVDYIIGNELEDEEVVMTEVDRVLGRQNDSKFYFIRRPDEQQTYKVALDIDLSTKFSDWIDPDLLRFERSELTKISINNYSIELDRASGNLMKMQADVINLGRATGTDAWTMDGLDAEKEDLKTARINDIVGVLDELKIAGVRPKLKFKDHVLLTQELKLNQQPEFKEDPRGFEQAMEMLQAQLDQKGFNLAGSATKMELVSQHGQLDVGTDKGVLYTLHVGKPVEGDEKELEIGSLGADEKKDTVELDKEVDQPDATKETESASAESGDEEVDKQGAETDAKDPVAEAKNRYMMVRVSLDQTLLGEVPTKPTEPTAPVKPEGYTPAEVEKPAAADNQKPETADEPDAPDDVESPEGADEKEEKPKRNPAFIDYDALVREYDQDKVEYELAMSRFEDQVKELDNRVVQAKKLVDELNQRFGDWYYVISADNLQTLQTKREDLATKKEPPATETPDADGAAQTRPNISFPALPGEDEGIQDPKTMKGPEESAPSEPKEVEAKDGAELKDDKEVKKESDAVRSTESSSDEKATEVKKTPGEVQPPEDKSKTPDGGQVHKQGTAPEGTSK